VTASHREAAETRFKPTRAGIINLWDYFDEEFAFADGRLALRGHNGSGKTKALEVLFPFVLDGSLDARRLDPFSGENRTMKANLLYRGQEAEHGYVWMEFARPSEFEPPSETVTLIIGLRAHRNWDRPRPSFYITEKRMGVEFGLLSADSRPLTAKQLTAVLGRDAHYGDKKGAYQEAVDSRLFGLGRQRYTQLLDLLIALRRPLLAKDLDPGKVSDTLTAGLSPVDEDLVEQAARDFENLAAVQKQYDDLAAADTAVRAFLVQYVAYLRVHTRHQLDQVVARMTAAAGHFGAIRVAAREVARSGQEERRAIEAGKLAKTSCETFDARLFALKNRDAYKDHEKLALRRSQLEKEQRALAAEQARLARAQTNVQDLGQETADLVGRLAEVGRAADRYARNLVEAAGRAGVTRDGEPADSGEDLRVTSKARAATRRDDIREIRAQIGLVRDAERDRRGAESALGTAQELLEQRKQSCRDADDQLGRARAAIAEDLRSWAGRWSSDGPYAVITGDQADTLAGALDQISEPDAPTLIETFTMLTQERKTTLITVGEQLKNRDQGLAEQETQRIGEREDVAGKRDDAPRPSDLRPADRTGRPGAPLWQLVSFADDLDDDAAAAIEGALYGAGLLTAWIHPDPALTAAAVAEAEADGYLVALPPAARPAGQTLADVLVPVQPHIVSEDTAQQGIVAPAVVAAVLASIAVADDVSPGSVSPNSAGRTGPAGTGPAGTGPAGTGPAGTGPAGTGAAGTGAVVTTRAQYSFGPYLGARPKSAAEFIGATNRANRRRARLAELDIEIAAIKNLRAEAAAELGRAGDALADLGRAQRELPRTAPVAAARTEVAHAAARLSAAWDGLNEARAKLDAAIAELDARARRLRRAGADHDMPVDPGEVDAVERAVTDFERTADDLVRARGEVVGLGGDLAGRRALIDKLNTQNEEAAELLGENEIEHAASEEKLLTDERIGGAAYEQIRDEIHDAETQLRVARGQLKAAKDKESEEHDKLVSAQNDLKHGRENLIGAVTELTAQAAAFAPYAHGDLRPLLDVTETAPWPVPGQWPAAEQLTTALVDRLAGEEDAAEPLEAISAVLPEGAVAVLGAFTAATRGGRAVTDGLLKGAVDRMWSAYREFENALKAGEDGYQADMTGDTPFVVDVATNEGRVPAAAFARKIAEDVENQGILLEERERTVLEDSLLTALAQQIHSRVLAAKDLVNQMDADTKSKPMSSGMAIGIGWVRSDKLTEQQTTVSRLLDRDAATLGPDGLAELRGLLRAMIHEHRASNPRDTYREVLGSVLDYRSWHTFELRMLQPGGPPERLTRKKHSEMSGGEKSAAIHMPLFAAANALYSSSKPTCPRMVALDEAFAGIDDKFKPELLGLTVRFDLDLFMTGHDLWVTYPTVPTIAHYDMQHDKAAHALSTLLALWDGEQLVDADAGYAGNEDLAAELLGFRATRHVPADVGDVLAVNAAGDDDDEGDEDAE
jgi:Putative exonuclease SbcCD, C subunit